MDRPNPYKLNKVQALRYFTPEAQRRAQEQRWGLGMMRQQIASMFARNPDENVLIDVKR